MYIFEISFSLPSERFKLSLAYFIITRNPMDSQLGCFSLESSANIKKKYRSGLHFTTSSQTIKNYIT